MSAQVVQQSSYTLTLSDQERNSLLALLRQAFAVSRVEVHRTHTPDFRELVLDEQIAIRSLIERLERLCPDSMGETSAIPVPLETEAPLIDALYIDEGGRFQMAAADLEDFLPFLRDHEVRVELETADAFRSGGETYGYGQLVHPYDADTVCDLYRTWKQARGRRTAGAMV